MSKFRLERLLEVKEQLMDDKKKEIESITSEIDKITENINSVDENINGSYNDMGTTTLSGNDFYVIKEYIIYLENKKVELSEQRSGLIAMMDILRSELIELAKEIKMLRILESKELKITKKSENRKEQKKLDQLALRVCERR